MQLEGVVLLFLLLELGLKFCFLVTQEFPWAPCTCGGPHIAMTLRTETRNWLLDMAFG